MTKNNNFDFLRFLFALLVVISHAFPLSGSNETKQWIFQITNGQLVLAQIGLSGFFIISGFFIFQSLERSKNLNDYFKKRFLRLFPALFFVLLFSLILGLIVYDGEIQCFKNIEFYTYLPYNLSLYGFQSGIKGVFDTNPYHAINGSLWTIKYEFTLYVILAMLFLFGNKNKIKIILLLLVYLIFLILYNFYLSKLGDSSFLGFKGYEVLNLGTFFIAGSVLASLKFQNLKNKKVILLLSALILCLSIYFNSYNLVKHLFLPIVILLMGYIPITFIKDFGKAGDSSYGIYIYSFPVQQTIMYFFKMETYTLILTSVSISIVFGYVSWHYIEKRALQYKYV